jgi:hypothetical protein
MKGTQTSVMMRAEVLDSSKARTMGQTFAVPSAGPVALERRTHCSEGPT